MRPFNFSTIIQKQTRVNWNSKKFQNDRHFCKKKYTEMILNWGFRFLNSSFWKFWTPKPKLKSIWPSVHPWKQHADCWFKLLLTEKLWSHLSHLDSFFPTWNKEICSFRWHALKREWVNIVPLPLYQVSYFYTCEWCQSSCTKCIVSCNL